MPLAGTPGGVMFCQPFLGVESSKPFAVIAHTAFPA
jgi:hypothetical protein